MEKKIIIVTGASRGIGKEIAKTLAKEGHTVIANYNKSEKEAQKLKEELKKENKEIEIYKADISKEEEIKKMVEYTIKKYKKASCLISLAPLSQPGKNGAIMILIIVVINPIIKEINKAC